VDEFRIRVLGKGGHGAYPHRAIDPVLIASQMVVAFQSIVSRQLDAARQAVITVGSIHGGTTSNVIPEHVDLEGTVRTLEPDVRAQAREAILRTARGVASAAGAPEPEMEYVFGTPSLYNEPALMDEALPVFHRVLGSENVVRYEPGMGGEDFSFFREAVPGIMFRLGVGRRDRDMNIHSAAFDPDERAVSLGVRLMSELLWDALERRTASE
jgi:amidohydrolase